MNTYWCFTINNPEEQLDVVFETDKQVRYAVWQLEKGENGTPHFQGYIQFRRSVRQSYLKKLMPTAHLEISKGTHEQNKKYCTKEDDRLEGPWEVGEPTTQGRRNDILELKRKIMEGKDDKTMLEEHPDLWLRYEHKFMKMRRLLNVYPVRNWKTIVTYVYGPPGFGKTYYAEQNTKNAYWKSNATEKWWDGYIGQEDVVLDEYRSGLTWTDFLQLLDAYPMDVQTKGQVVPMLAKQIIITTNCTPCQLYDMSRFPLDALTRRVNKFVYFYEKYKFKEFQDENRYTQFTSFLEEHPPLYEQ